MPMLSFALSLFLAGLSGYNVDHSQYGLATFFGLFALIVALDSVGGYVANRISQSTK